MKLESFLDKENVIFLENEEKQLAIREMTDWLQNQGKISNSLRYYSQVIHREALENTGIGHSVAIPHARTDSVNEMVTLLGVSKNGVDYQAYDDRKVKFILLCLFPTHLSTKYLFLISMIAKIFSLEENRLAISRAENVDEIYSALKTISTEYFATISEKKTCILDHSANLAGVPTSDLDLLIRLDRLYEVYETSNSDTVLMKINEMKGLIDNRSLSYYEKMRSRCKTPFAIVEKNSCSGCHMTIPPIELNAIKERCKISLCTHCGRFLITI